MPKIFEYMGMVIMFYSNEHAPVHVHGKFQGMESKAELIIEAGSVVGVKIKKVPGKRPLDKVKIKEFEKFVTLFSDQIVQAWVDYFVYHKEVRCIKVEGRVK